ncbi:FAD-binding oxidoreductase [Paracoccus fistulariae]|uniref:D-lactate dehydrogenase (cytochrome) n=1 Tax=Paracoccus fistulariae TaxID=658446 RepID=A0ABY7SNT0_9RHOB|nr:FAD-linked oxidase C-terminal domain-containing protein [Paracoccus fistulariae]MDB6182384.1 FAD-binding protein [Paracoccus fistulariae]WCR08638.1 FAD-binding protein [Paracoccus fistulariae]
MPLPDDLSHSLQALLGTRFSVTQADRGHHAQSESFHSAPPPDAVVWPRTTEEVARIVAACADAGVPLVAWGAGTSLEGHALAYRGGVTLDLSQMDRVIEIRAPDMQVTVQPGVTREALNTELRATGLFFPVDPGANASLGGMASTRASGTTAVRYGTMRDNVLALQVVMADGRVIRTGTRAAKSSAGYDLTGLFVGAEGTLGIITELTLKLHGQPEEVASAVCAFETLDHAVECVSATIQSGIPMARIEFVDAATARAFNLHSGASLPEMPHLMVEFHGSPGSVREDATRFGEIAEDFGATGFDWATTPEDRARLWRMRHGAYHACLALRSGAKGVVTDVCVPMSELPAAVHAAAEDIAAAGLLGPIVGHVGDGNFHSLLLVDPDDKAEIAAAKEVARKMAERALSVGGTITGEHGIGVGKRDLMAAQHGDGWQVMGAIKQALDPQDILNPGKMLPDRN